MYSNIIMKATNKMQPPAGVLVELNHLGEYYQIL